MFENLNYLDAIDIIETRKDDPKLPKELLKFYKNPMELYFICFYGFEKRVKEFEEIISTNLVASHAYK